MAQTKNAKVKEDPTKKKTYFTTLRYPLKVKVQYTKALCRQGVQTDDVKMILKLKILNQSIKNSA